MTNGKHGSARMPPVAGVRASAREATEPVEAGCHAPCDSKWLPVTGKNGELTSSLDTRRRRVYPPRRGRVRMTFRAV